MSSGAAAALKLGQVVAARAAKSWLERNRRAKERRMSLAELAALELSGPVKRARFDNAIAGIGHQVAEQLAPMLEQEFRDIPEYDASAAVESAAEMLASAEFADDVLFDSSMDAKRVAHDLLQSSDGDRNRRNLSTQGEHLFTLIIEEACSYLLVVIQQLPAFQPRALVHVLDLLSAQSGDLAELLARMPKSTLLAPRGVANDEAFKLEYLTTVGRALEKIDILGLPMRQKPRLRLDVAYLSLTASPPTRRLRGRAPKEKAGTQGWVKSNASSVDRSRVEEVIGDARLTLIRGEAGSGKTTLLDWLAITAASNRFSGPLQAWNEMVPFMIRLRSFADVELPAPEDFLKHSFPLISDIAPDAWAYRVLASGRAVVLVDGVDEVPIRRRRLVRSGLTDLVRTFADIRVIVTARPSAADSDWLADLGFQTLDLEPMATEDVSAFIDRWHDAASQTGNVTDWPSGVNETKRRLLAQLTSRPHLRSIATNPLLCSMLCALNVTHPVELPRSRMELYRAALDMLLTLRDAERDIPSLLETPAKIVILRDIAWRLTLDNRVELSLEEVASAVEEKLPSMPRISSEATELLAHLLDRSGVIRQPVPGRVDFVHRTFQEYLAADEATERRHIGLLVQMAHLDQWWETIVLACGHAKSTQAEDLLNGILERADAERRRARRLRLLVAACLETADDLDPGLRIRIDQMITAHLVPPRGVREVASLAAIGPSLIDYLPATTAGLSPASARATVRSVVLSGSDQSIDRLSSYSVDGRVEVQSELLAGWRYFDPQAYAERVLAEAPLVNGTAVIDTVNALPFLGTLKRMNRSLFSLDVTNGEVNLATLADARGLENLKLHSADGAVVIDLATVASLPDLSELTVSGAGSLLNPSALADAPNLRSLNLSVSLMDASFLGSLQGLKSLTLTPGHMVTDLSGIGELKSLEVLSIYGHAGLDSIDFLVELTELSELTVTSSRAANWSALRGLSNLQTVLLDGSRAFADLRLLANSKLQMLSVTRTGVTDLRPLRLMTELDTVYLDGCRIDDWTPLAHLDSVTVFVDEEQRDVAVAQSGHEQIYSTADINAPF
jgi:hypothetical protein